MLGSSILKDRNHLLFIIESLVLQKFFVVGFQSLSCVQLFATPWTAAHQASLSSTISQSLLKFTSIKLVMLFNHLILCRPLLHLPSIFPSISVFPNALILGIRWPKYWNFSFSISPSSEYSGLICFRIDWFDLLAVQGTLKGLLQHHSSRGLRFPSPVDHVLSDSRWYLNTNPDDLSIGFC